MGCAIETRTIGLGDRARIDALYAKYGHGDSAHAFPSLYLWQEDMGLSLALWDDAYTARCRWKGENAWFFPVGGDAAKAACVGRLLDCGCRRLHYLTRVDVDFLNRAFPGVFNVREASGDSEYLYDRWEMIDMPGKRFVKIRNLYRKLEREHAVSSEPVTASSLSTAARIADQWQRTTAADKGVSDGHVMARIFGEWDVLGLRGTLLRLDGEPWAVAAGYPLADGAFDCCLMKARENLPGVAEQLRVALARSLPEGVARLNFEEDLGLEGLRLMKVRLRPCGMIRMYTGERI